jgi:hypothetical protein
LFSVLGTLPDPSPRFQTIPWTDVEVTAAVQPDSSLSLTLQYFIGDYQSEERIVTASLGQQRCIQLPSASGNGDLLLCVTDVDATSKYQNNAADLTLEFVLNVTWPSSVPQTVYANTFVSDFIDCRLRVREMAMLCISSFFCIALPILFFFTCPPPVAHRVEPQRLQATLADLDEPSRLTKFLVKLQKATLDSNMWGSFMYLAASAMYVHARVSPDYLDEHPEYRNHLYIWAAALYLWSAVFYHIAWEQSPVVPTMAELFESYLNILGSSGFVASAVMYLWGDFKSLGKPTFQVEFVFYILWLFEEVFNAWASAEWYSLSTKAERLVTVKDYVKATYSVLTSFSFWANVCSFVGSMLYVVASGMLMDKTVRTVSYLNSEAEIEAWAVPGTFDPPFTITMEPPDLDKIQGLADWFYFFDSLLFIWTTWATFDIQLTNEPMPQLPLPSDPAYDVHPSATDDDVVYRPDTPEADVEIPRDSSSRELIASDILQAEARLPSPTEGSINRSSPSVRMLTRQQKRYSIRRSCLGHIVCACLFRRWRPRTPATGEPKM